LTDLTEMAGADPFDLMESEARNIHDFYAKLHDQGWSTPTRCVGWNRRDLLAHLAAVEEYIRAGLDDNVGALLSRSGAHGLDQLNAWGVRKRAGVPRDQLLSDWYEAIQTHIARLRQLPPDATMDTSVGQYPARRQAYYLAAELAIHADDAAIGVPEVDQPSRRAWRVRFGRVALDETGRGVIVTAGDRGQLVRVGDEEALLTDDDFVEATSGRLADEHPLSAKLRDALRVLA
jgi:uncharacterized protein (TIGR03083 family)